MRQDSWDAFAERLCVAPSLGLSLDISRMRVEEGFFERMAPEMEGAFEAMDALERGEIANPDEGRMVGHYWLRAPQLAPGEEIARSIRGTVERVKNFAADVRAGRVRPPSSARFARFISIGIGGSALGPMFVSDALGAGPVEDAGAARGSAPGRLRPHFIDNTDPDGIARTLAGLDGRLGETLCLVVSKSGGTPETRNGMLAVRAAYERGGLDFAAHAVAVTGEGSRLDRQAQEEGWLARFPMWDWVGGRTSELSAVGLLPAALEGIDIDGLLAGAAECDALTRRRDARGNPAALLALAWHHAGAGRGERAMVVLPYKDRLLLLGRYLQQLVMESLGKRYDLSGREVEQGLTVYGNKGSTDQHAYVQQLRDGRDDFFVTFVRVLEAGADDPQVEPGASAGDYLHALLLGTRAALTGRGRRSMTLTIPRVDARRVGALIALFERAVGLYAGLINVNAYHQPGVEAGKTAAAELLDLQRRIEARLSATAEDAAGIAAAVGAADRVEDVYLILEHLSANGRARMVGDADPRAARFAALARVPAAAAPEGQS